jgi:hypothetical protein
VWGNGKLIYYFLRLVPHIFNWQVWNKIYCNCITYHPFINRKGYTTTKIIVKSWRKKTIKEKSVYWSACTKPGKWAVMYILKCPYQARKVSSHVHIEVPVQSQESEQSCTYWSACTKLGKWAVMYMCICVLVVLILPLSTIFLLDFGLCCDRMVYFCFLLYYI